MSKKASKTNSSRIKYNDFDFSGLNNTFYNFKRERLLKFRPLERRLSSEFIDYSIKRTDEEFVLIAIKYIVHTAYSLFYYITGEKDLHIDFDTTTHTSFCCLTYNHIQIGINVLFDSTIPEQVRVDVITGVIFHEFFHKRFTIRDLLKRNFINKEHYYDDDNSKKAIASFLKNEFSNKVGGKIFNILEDRRIERMGINDFPGYGFFFDELRKYAFFINLEFRTIAHYVDFILTYLIYKVLLPEGLDDFYNKILSERNELLKLKDIGDNAYKLLTYNAIVEIDTYLNRVSVDSDNINDIIATTKSIMALIPSDIVDPSYLNESTMTVNTSEPFTDGSVDLHKNKVSAKIQTKVKEIQQAESNNTVYNNDKVDDENDSVNVKLKLEDNFFNYTTVNIINAPIEKRDRKLYKEAKKMSNNIFRNLGFLDSHYKQQNTLFELDEGDIDETELFSINWNKNIFVSEYEDNGYNLDIGVLLDESGSMMINMQEAKKAFLALILAIKDNKHINLFAYGHTANNDERTLKSVDSSHSISIYKYYNTLENFCNIDRVFSAVSRCNNADGFAIQQMGKIMSRSKNKNKVLFVISDGQPHAVSYGGNSAIEHTKEEIEKLENNNFFVIQICVAYIEESSKMFKHFVEYKSETSFFNEIQKVLINKITQFIKQI